jgi:hypothetical protein
MYQLDCLRKTAKEIGDELLNMYVVDYPVWLADVTDKKAFATRDYLLPSLIKFHFRQNSGQWIVSIK